MADQAQTKTETKTVKVAKLGQGAEMVTLKADEGLTELLSKSGISDKANVRINGTPAKDYKEDLKEGDVVMTVPQVRGGVA